MLQRERKCLFVAGLDPTGEAGLLRDVAVATALGVRAGGVPTCLVAENAFAVRSVTAVAPDEIAELVDMFLEERPATVTKVGLVPPTVAKQLATELWARRDRLGTIVLDPVMSATVGFSFHDPRHLEGLRELVALADVVTPNEGEARALGAAGSSPDHASGLDDAVEAIMALGPETVVVTGVRDREGRVCDHLYMGRTKRVMARPMTARVARGTGCAFSAALAALLAVGAHTPSAVKRAGDLVSEWLAAGIHIGANVFGLGIRPVAQ